MKTKIIASTLILGLAVSLLMFMFIIGCGVTTDNGVTPSIPRLYVSDITNKKVLIIDPSSLTILSSIELPGATSPKWMAIKPDGSKVYIADEGDYRVYILNTSTNTVSSVEVCSSPRGMAFNSDGSKLFVTQGNWDVSIVDAINDTFTDDPGVTTIYGFGNGNYGITFNPVLEKIYVASRTSGRIYIASAEAGSTPTFEVQSNAYDVAVGPGGHSIYVTTHDGPPNQIVSFEAETLSLVASFDVSSDGARNIALSPDGNSVYVTICDYSYIDYFNLNTASVEAINVRTGGPTGNYQLEQLTFSQDGSRVYAVNSDTDQVVIIDTATNTWTGVVTLPASADYFGIVYKP